MINWGKSMPVVDQASSTGNTFSGLSWTAVVWTRTSCTRRHHRGPSGRSVTPTWISLLNLDMPWLGTSPPGKECVYENPWHLENNRVNHVFLRLDGKRRRCKGCHVLNICKEVVTGCPTCNIHLCKNCYLARHWVKKLVKIWSPNVIDSSGVKKLWLW